MRKRAAVVTFWHEQEGGYWEATAYVDDPHDEFYGEVMTRKVGAPIAHATSVSEAHAIGQALGELYMHGYTDISLYSSGEGEPTLFEVSWFGHMPFRGGHDEHVFRSWIDSRQWPKK